jgi:hemolysin III
MLTPEDDFPRYTEAERAVDRIVHLAGLAAAALGAGWLLIRVGPGATGKQIVVVLVYVLGLIGMLGASCLYNLARPSRFKAVLRRLDHSMIFVMIGGSYTPFANTLSRGAGLSLCATVWGLAAIGIGLKLFWPLGIELAYLGLYLAMGWLVLGFVPSLLAVLKPNVLLLLFAGGVIYSAGAIVHTLKRVPFQNAIWHALVVAGAGVQFAAVAQLFPPGG